MRILRRSGFAVGLNACLNVCLAAGLSAVGISPAQAQWVPAPAKLAGLSTWIYKPAATLPNRKHALLVVLHGCAQTSTELKRHGNLAAAADAAGMVLALPQVPAKTQWGPGCWDYDGGTDAQGHAAQVVRLTTQLLRRPSLQVDAAQVYVAGLSSGGALSLLLGCKAPALFAGVAAVAGPSLGSDQMLATTPFATALPETPSRGVATCLNLAGTQRSHLQSQIANVAAGSMDRDGEEGRYPVCAAAGTAMERWFCPKDKHPGQYEVVSVKWADYNAEILRTLYGAGELGAPHVVAAGQAEERTAQADGRVRLARLQIHGVGHAWPAGTGQAANPEQAWIATAGLNYPAYLMPWLLAHNLRASAAPR